MIVRNFLGGFMEAYQEKWAIFMRKCILAVILTRGGLNITFRGKGFLTILLVLAPQTVEVFAHAFLAVGFFKMPLSFGFCLSYVLGTVSAAVLVPGMLALKERKYGSYKGVPGTLIVTGSFENILSLILFGIVNAIADSQAMSKVTGAESNISMDIGIVFIQMIVGLAVGVAMGFVAWIFRFFETKPYSIYLKGIYCFCVAQGIVMASEFSKNSNA